MLFLLFLFRKKRFRRRRNDGPGPRHQAVPPGLQLCTSSETVQNPPALHWWYVTWRIYVIFFFFIIHSGLVLSLLMNGFNYTMRTVINDVSYILEHKLCPDLTVPTLCFVGSMHQLLVAREFHFYLMPLDWVFFVLYLWYFLFYGFHKPSTHVHTICLYNHWLPPLMLHHVLHSNYRLLWVIHKATYNHIKGYL